MNSPVSEIRQSFFASKAILIGCALGLVAILTSSVLLLQHGYKEVSAYAQANLTVIAELKATELERWVEDKRGRIYQPPSSFLAGVFEHWQQAAGTHSEAARDTVLREKMGVYLARYPEGVSLELYDVRGRFVLSTDEKSEGKNRSIDTKKADDSRAKLIDFYTDSQGAVRLAFSAPLSVSRLDHEQLIGFMVLVIDPQQYLYPTLQKWPLVSLSAEALLIEPRGNEAVFLSPVRHSPMSPLSENRLMKRLQFDTAQFLVEGTHVAPGRDYRDVEVLRAIRPVKNSAWIVVAKVDKAEALADFWRDVCLIGACMLFSFISIFMLLRQSWISARDAQEKSNTKLLRAFIDAVPETLLMIRSDGLLRFINTTGAARLGGVPEQLGGANIFEKLPGVFSAERRAAIEQACSSDHAVSLQDSRQGVDYLSMLYPLGDGAHAVLIATDVTRQNAATHALQESQESLRRLTDNLPDSFLYQVAQDSNGVRRFVYVSSGVERVFGISASVTLGNVEWLFSRIDPAQLAAVREEQIRSLSGDFCMTLRMRLAGDIWGWVSLHSRRRPGLSDSGEIIWDGVATDVTELRKKETRLLENLATQQSLNKKLEEAHNQLLQSEKLAAIGQLAAGVAHELNNPIGFVHSNLGTLTEYVTALVSLCDQYGMLADDQLKDCPQLTEIQRIKQDQDYNYLRGDIFPLLAESREGLQRVRNIVQDLRDFSRTGKQDWALADLHNGLNATLNIVANELKYKCVVRKELGVLPEVLCVISQINQVFMNLLVNAAQAIETSGEIILRSGLEGAEHVWISVSDTGKGIPPDVMKRIFEPFFTTKPVGVGTGLGLSLVFGIVARHQGRIEVESEQGQGTTFRMVLPIRQAIGVINDDQAPVAEAALTTAG